jgi:hypothetical protein
MHITCRLGHGAYQRMRAEHLAAEALRASPPEDDPTPPPNRSLCWVRGAQRSAPLHLSPARLHDDAQRRPGVIGAAVHAATRAAPRPVDLPSAAA